MVLAGLTEGKSLEANFCDDEQRDHPAASCNKLHRQLSCQYQPKKEENKEKIKERKNPKRKKLKKKPHNMTGADILPYDCKSVFVII